jgi:hypothetical protein
VIDRYDELEGYCRMLGHHLSFQYCRTVADGLPCGKILDCWFEKIDAAAFVQEHYSEAERERIFAPPKPKVASLLELIENARKETKTEPDG